MKLDGIGMYEALQELRFLIESGMDFYDALNEVCASYVLDYKQRTHLRSMYDSRE